VSWQKDQFRVEEEAMEKYGYRNPEPRSCALLRVARQALGIPLTVPASAVNRNWATISNAEEGRYRLGEATERRLLFFYLKKFEERGFEIDVLPDDADRPEIRIALAKAVVIAQSAEVAHQSEGLGEASEGLNLGSSDFLERAIDAALRRPALPVVTRRLLKRIAEDDEARAAVPTTAGE
jgi:hypothetical protein